MSFSILKHIPNILSSLRLILGLMFIIFDSIDKYLFITGSVSDFFDGFFARKFNIESNFGRLIDPIADKIFITSSMIILFKHNLIGIFWLGLSITKDVLIILGYLARSKKNQAIKPNIFGKLSTAFQMLGCATILIGSESSWIWSFYAIFTVLALYKYAITLNKF
ncbi:CDP-alcohol phosphatidyltransferase family protein [Candidatus Gromoviella agglomerans]|uniref:CDP-alcohol phosphatidyltransferase family protein n=1 Tax=Candidatus Gromoviella agglomerans TaxID=2806609 RepID=UPI002367C667|nr:CDP-alcohol phosphatidyltransferase family protein [Candidatus Gromoviella agglomerans]UFX98517.1 CDP-diacylglycerol--glycerol-3-phosphate 3-phosphatidyltransferase [Candidatus Gromoviella agglomerans]